MIVLRNNTLKSYIESKIIPQYKKFDPAHQEGHVRDVISNALDLGKFYDVNPDMLYTAAAYHDLGLSGPRDSHHILGGEIVRKDKNLRKWFTEEQIETIARAVEDHRASKGAMPRDIYGKIISEADRIIDPVKTIERSYGFNKDKYDDPREIVWKYLREKYGRGGYVKPIIPESENSKKLKEFQKILDDRRKFDKIYDSLTK